MEIGNEEWKRDALRLASERIPFVQGSMKAIVEEIQAKHGVNINYQAVRTFLYKNGYKTHERNNRKGTTKDFKGEWKEEALSEARKRVPFHTGDIRRFYRDMQENYPDIKYSSFANFLGQHGFRTDKYKKSKKGLKMQKQTNEFVGKIGSEIGATSYAIVKINGKKSIVSKPMPISNEEAMAIMEKRMF